MKLALILAAALAGAGQLSADRESPAATPEARAAVHEFGRCVVRNSRELAAETLQRDFTSRGYRAGLRTLARANASCFRERGAMRTEGLPFAGALAEALLAEEATPVNVRLARAALGPATPARSGSDAIAICVVRSVPDETARLFATAPASAEEAAAIEAIEPVAAACNRTGRRFEASPAGLRAMLATAAFRSVASAPEAVAAGE